MYHGPCTLRPTVPPEKCGLELNVVLKFRDNYIKNVRVVPLIASLKMEGIVKWRHDCMSYCVPVPQEAVSLQLSV